MTITLEREAETSADLDGIDPPVKTTLEYDMYDAGDYQVGERVTLRPEFDDVPNVDVPRPGTIVRIDTDGSAFPIIVWLDEFGEPTQAERDAHMGLPVCAGDIERVA